MKVNPEGQPEFEIATSRSIGISFSILEEAVREGLKVSGIDYKGPGQVEILGSRAPSSVTFKMIGSPRENWCDLRQHYVNKDSHPIFTVYPFRSRNSQRVCFKCYMQYPKDGSSIKGDPIPDTSEPCYTTGELKFKRTI